MAIAGRSEVQEPYVLTLTVPQGRLYVLVRLVAAGPAHEHALLGFVFANRSVVLLIHASGFWRKRQSLLHFAIKVVNARGPVRESWQSSQGRSDICMKSDQVVNHMYCIVTTHLSILKVEAIISAETSNLWW